MKKNKRKKGSSLFGLIFLLVIIAGGGYYLFRTLTKDNLTVMVYTYHNRQVLPKATVTLDGSKYETQLDGMAIVKMRAGLGDTLLVKAQYGDMTKYVSLIVTQERLNAGYTKADILLASKHADYFFEKMFGIVNKGNKDFIIKK